MCCGPKIHHNAMTILREQISKSMVRRPVVDYTQPVEMKSRVLFEKGGNKQKSITNNKTNNKTK